MCSLFPMQAMGYQHIGMVVFYSYDSTGQKQDRAEVEADFTYHVGGILKLLENKSIRHQIVREPNFSIEGIDGVQVQIENELIPVSTGYVMVRNNGDYVVRNGMGTDADMLMDIFEYFGVGF